MYRNLRPICELTPDDFVDKEDAMVKTAAQEIRDLVQRIRKHAEEERELVRAFFRDMVASEPLWLVPSLLGFVANEAAVAEMQISRCIAGTIPIDDLPY